MKWISEPMHARDVQDFLRQYDFKADTLIITHIYNWDVLVTFFATKKKEEQL